MRISKPRREMIKQDIKSLVAARPRLSNIDIASELGIHRNTVSRLLDEVRVENAKWVNERWKMLLNDVTNDTQEQLRQLNQLYQDSYWSGRSKPSQSVAIVKARWALLKDLYRFHLEYMGIRQDPRTLVQVNLNH